MNRATSFAAAALSAFLSLAGTSWSQPADSGTLVPLDPSTPSLPLSPSPSPGAPGAVPTEPAAQEPAPDLLSKLEDAPKPSFLRKLKGWLGAGGSAAKQAAKAFSEGDYDLALQKLAEAELDRPGSQALAYNAGNAQYRKKKYDEAAAAYKKALHGDDAGLAASAYYNLGNALFRKGEFAVQSGKQTGIDDYREAMAHYKKSLEIRPDNKDAKRNIEVVQQRIKELLERQEQEQQQNPSPPQKPPEPSAAAKQVFARAMQLVQERRYAEAKALLEDLIQKDKTAISYQVHVQRINDVLGIQRGEVPAAPVPQDPRSRQGGMGVI